MPPRETTTPTGDVAGTDRFASLVSRQGGPHKYTTEEVGKHSTPEDCWVIVHGKVYDVSAFVPKRKSPRP